MIKETNLFMAFPLEIIDNMNNIIKLKEYNNTNNIQNG